MKRRLFPLTFSAKMMGFIALLIIAMFVLLGVFLNEQYARTLEEQMGERALSVAQAVALIPELREAFSAERPDEIIQPIAESIRVETGAEFIVVGNTDLIRYAHPLPERIGQRMVGGDNERALVHGESYVSKAVGSLGPSIRGKVPVFDDNGKIIGIVSVGFLMEDIQQVIGERLIAMWQIVVVIMILGLMGTWLVANTVKKATLGLEPEEIGQQFQQKEAILQSIHEGVIAVNKEGKVTLFNQAAMKYVDPGLDKEDVLGRHVTDLVKHTRLPEVLQVGKGQYDQELRIGDKQAVVNRVPIYYDHEIVGAVATFRDRNEIKKLSEELTNVKKYADALRAQTHEFSNKLNTISGFLQLGKIDEAVDFIHKERKIQQEWIHFFIERVNDPTVSAVLLGKISQAQELGIDVDIDPSSQLLTPLHERQQELLVTMIGNLLENAFDALLASGIENKKIYISFTDMGDDFIFEVEDNGPGIPPQLMESIFEEGFSTKEGTHRGFGLALVKKAVHELGGAIFLEEGELGGACFVLTIPKHEAKEGWVS
ncbi:sensor histidine kinase [Halalkalibacterium halodurans]|uniref:sensor histidine kinase n=2 Tax=Halalkalibacterium halodurans TaxID=86665 RepID=UPI002E211469|nr:sensor histidine kinase [Halalkalibacterium halodurans]